METIWAVVVLCVVGALAYPPELAFARSRFPFQSHPVGDRSVDGEAGAAPGGPVRKDGKSKSGQMSSNGRELTIKGQ